MRAHVVLAHPEPRSYNAHLAETARATLADTGWNVTVSDLKPDAPVYSPFIRRLRDLPLA